MASFRGAVVKAMQLQLEETYTIAAVRLRVSEEAQLTIRSNHTDSAAMAIQDTAVHEAACDLQGEFVCVAERVCCVSGACFAALCPQVNRRRLRDSDTIDSYSVSRQYDVESNIAIMSLPWSVSQRLNDTNASLASTQISDFHVTTTLTTVGVPEANVLSWVQFVQPGSTFRQQLLLDVPLSINFTQSLAITPPTLPPVQPPPAIPPVQPGTPPVSALLLGVCLGSGFLMCITIIVVGCIVRRYARPPVEQILPPAPMAGWTEHFNADGVPYYHHDATGRTTWDKPGEVMAEELRQERKKQRLQAAARSALAFGSCRLSAERSSERQSQAETAAAAFTSAAFTTATRDPAISRELVGMVSTLKAGQPALEVESTDGSDLLERGFASQLAPRTIEPQTPIESANEAGKATASDTQGDTAALPSEPGNSVDQRAVLGSKAVEDDAQDRHMQASSDSLATAGQSAERASKRKEQHASKALESNADSAVELPSEFVTAASTEAPPEEAPPDPTEVASRAPVQAVEPPSEVVKTAATPAADPSLGSGGASVLAAVTDSERANIAGAVREPASVDPGQDVGYTPVLNAVLSQSGSQDVLVHDMAEPPPPVSAPPLAAPAGLGRGAAAIRAAAASARHSARLKQIMDKLKVDDGDNATEAGQAQQMVRAANVARIANQLQDVGKAAALRKPARLPPIMPGAPPKEEPAPSTTTAAFMDLFAVRAAENAPSEDEADKKKPEKPDLTEDL